jgi:hypothetical protein
VGVDGATLSFSDQVHKAPLNGLRQYCSSGLPDEIVVYDGDMVAVTTWDDGGYLLVVGRNEEGEIVAAEVLNVLSYPPDEDEEDD